MVPFGDRRHPMSPTAHTSTRGTQVHEAREDTRHTTPPPRTRALHPKARGIQATQMHEPLQGTRGTRAPRASSRMTNRPIDPTMTLNRANTPATGDVPMITAPVAAGALIPLAFFNRSVDPPAGLITFRS